MKQGWEIKKLGDVCKVIAGQSPEGKYYNFEGDGMPFYQGKKEYCEKYIGSPTTWTTKITKEAEEGDILMSVRAPVGPVNFATQKICIGRGLAAIRAGKYIDKNFLYNFFLKHENEIVGNAGAVFNSINKTQIENLPIPIPPLSEQQRIVSIIDEAFAAIAKAKANAEQNLKNAKELLESNLNMIKADKVELGSLVLISTGKLNANAAKENGQYPFFTCSKEVFAIDNYAFDLEAILLAGNNASGDFNVKHYIGKFNAYQRTYIITVNEKQNILYRYLYYQMLKSLKKFKEMSVGANTKFLKLGMIQGLKIALPSIEDQEKIVLQLDSLSDEIKKLEAVYQKKIEDLEELKKSILQKAFAGEL